MQPILVHLGKNVSYGAFQEGAPLAGVWAECVILHFLYAPSPCRVHH